MSQTTATHDADLRDLIARAKEGDRSALETFLRHIKDEVFGLALRMLWHPQDAEDATQEILLKVVTHLGTFRGESAVRTWVFRIATNHVLNVKRSRVEAERLTFDGFGAQLVTGLAEPRASPASDPDQALLEEEVKIGCTTGMLLCLDRDLRIAYILGDVFGMRSDAAAEALGIDAAAFRKRLSRARERLRSFMRQHCGLVSAAAPCRCARRVDAAIAGGRVEPERLLFASHPRVSARGLPVLEQVDEMEQLHEIAGIYQSHPRYAAPDRVIADVRRLIDGGRFTLLA